MDRSLELHQTITNLFCSSHTAPTTFPFPSAFVHTAAQISHALTTFSQALEVGGSFDQQTPTPEALSNHALLLKADLEQLKAQLSDLTDRSSSSPVHSEIQSSLQKRLAQAANTLSQRVTKRTASLRRQQARTTTRYTANEHDYTAPEKESSECALMLPQTVAPTTATTAVRKRPNASSMEEVQRTISEIGAMFSELAHLVAQQGDSLQRIDEGVGAWAVNCEGAQREIDALFASVKSDRALLVKFFVVLAAVVVLWAKFIK